MSIKGFRIGIDPVRQEVDGAKQRQVGRKENVAPTEVTNEVLYQMLYDILENQALLENKVNKLMKHWEV